MNKNSLVNYLENEIDNLKLDNYTEFTRENSKGFRKGIGFVLKKIKELEE